MYECSCMYLIQSVYIHKKGLSNVCFAKYIR